jgi:hypothetical protein
MEYIITIIMLIALAGALLYMVLIDPHPEITLTPERRAEILKAMQELREKKRKQRKGRPK